MLVTAARGGWPTASVCGLAFAGLLLTTYWWRRKHWDRTIRLQGLAAVAAVEVLLRRPDQG